ncbi:MAG: LPS-assembly protein LptD, partial [Pseudomonadota bacterium]|nr:LPS-assembly protein LptD [Pseudomonadota bacterium]
NYSIGLYTSFDYTRVCVIEFFRDLDTVSLAVSSTTHLKESGTIGYQTANWNSSVKVEQFQTIARNTTTPYQQMPRINVDGNYDLGWDLRAELNHEYTDFDHRDADDEVWVTGQRAFLDYGITWDKDWVWGFFKPSVMVKHLSYELDDKHLDADANDSPSITVPQGSLDMGLYFEREGSLLGRGYIQTFEPRLYYFYSDYESHDELFDVAGTRDIDFDTSELTFTYSQLFRDRRFSGHDRIGDDNRLSVGLTTRFIEAATGIERFSASVGQIYYYDDRVVDLSANSATAKTLTENLEDTSEIAVAMSARIGDYWQFNSDLLFDEDDNNKTSRGSMSLRYRDDNYNLFNIGYRYVRKNAVADVNDVDNDGDVAELIDRDIEQADVSFALPIGGNWSAVARYNHDVTNSRELETLAGLEYSDCCYRVRVVARRWLDNDLHTVIDDTLLEEDQGIFFEFQLRGLGGIGSKVNGVLSDGIYGYDLREENLK